MRFFKPIDLKMELEKLVRTLVEKFRRLRSRTALAKIIRLGNYHMLRCPDYFHSRKTTP